MYILIMLVRIETLGFALYTLNDLAREIKPEHRKLVAVFAVATVLAFGGVQ